MTGGRIGNSEGSPEGAKSVLYQIRTIRSGQAKPRAYIHVGTTISRSLTELYLLFQYRRPNELERQKLDLRCVGGNLCQKDNRFEFNVQNNIVAEGSRFQILITVPELRVSTRDNRLTAPQRMFGVTVRISMRYSTNIPAYPGQKISFRADGYFKNRRCDDSRQSAVCPQPKEKGRRCFYRHGTMPERWLSI